MRLSGMILIVIASMSLSACYSMRGTDRLVTKDLKPANFKYADIEMFVRDFEAAEKFRFANPSGNNPHVKPMLRSGFMYNYGFCEAYFNKMAKNQRTSKISRSLLAPITSVITGIIGLQDFSQNPGEKEDLIQGLAIGSAAATSLLDIYDEHLLFGTDNIDSVETMTLKALNAHGIKVLEQKDIYFETAMQHLIDNQGQCSPQAILTLARASIKNSNIVAKNQNSGLGAAADETREGKVTVGVQEN